MCRRVGDGAFKSKTDCGGVAYHLHRLKESPGNDVPAAARPKRKATGSPPDLADVATRHAVYSALLDSLTLDSEHREDLMRRGFPPEEIERRQYRSMPGPGRRRGDASSLSNQFGRETLLSVPGFFRNARGGISIACLPSLLIPVRDPEGQIVALKSRPGKPLDDGIKYLYVSSKNRGGPGPGAPAHVPLGADRSAAVWRMTEGELKADVATVLSDIPTLSAPGVSNWQACIPYIRAMGCERIRLAFDADLQEKPEVARALAECFSTLSDEGMLVEVECWDPAAGKGIDDVLAAGGDADVLTGDEALSFVSGAAQSAGVEWQGVRSSSDINGRPYAGQIEGGRGRSASTPPGGPSTPGRPVATDDSINRTDLGNARRLVRLFGDRLRYCKAWGEWLVWDETRWKVDTTGEVHRMAKRAVRSIGIEASEADDDDEAKALHQWALASESKKHLDAMIGLAWSEPGIPVEPGQLDSDPWLLNVANGTIDLRTGVLREHSPNDLITKIAPVRYDPSAECPLWKSTLNRIMEGSQELIAFLGCIAGYALTGETTEHVLFFLYGTGRNGKSTFLNTLQSILGDYATTVDSSLLTVKRSEDHPTGLTDLDGRRFVSTVEVEDGKRLAEALVKKLTGGERIKARKMRQDFYEFSPTYKIFLSANHKPEIRGTDEGIWSRIKTIPFTVFIPEPERDKDLGKKLLAEAPGILTWMVQGCLEWQERGLNEPRAVTEATAGYRAEMDAIGDFLAECIDSLLDHPTLKAQSREKPGVLYGCYSEWAKTNGVDVLTPRKFGSEMEYRGYRLRTSNGQRYRYGLRLKSENDPYSDV